MKYWDYIKNFPQRPEHRTRGQPVYGWFHCIKCGHSHETSLSDIIKLKGCKYCNGDDVCNNECTPCYEKSFASSDKAYMWSPLNKLTARQVPKNSAKDFHFECPDCNHTFISKPNWVIPLVGCRFCTGSDLCENNDCKFCYHKSFASEEESIFWHPNNRKTARQVCKNSGELYSLYCTVCKNWFWQSPNHIMYDAWCPCLGSKKTEYKLYLFLKERFPQYFVDKQFKAEWLRQPVSRNRLFMDFKIENIIIELDGIQHTELTGQKWNNFVGTRKRDVYKMILSIKNGLSVIRISQNAVWRDKFDWKSILVSQIQRLLNSNIPEVVYIENPYLSIIKYQIHKKYFDLLINENLPDNEWESFMGDHTITLEELGYEEEEINIDI